jgi:IS5 family transposase
MKIKESLVAAEEREAKLDRLGDVLQVLEKPGDFAALAAVIDQAAPRPGRERWASAVSHRVDGAR